MPTVQQWGRRESIIWPPRTLSLYPQRSPFLARSDRILSSMFASSTAFHRSNATTCRTISAARCQVSRVIPTPISYSMFPTANRRCDSRSTPT